MPKGKQNPNVSTKSRRQTRRKPTAEKIYQSAKAKAEKARQLANATNNAAVGQKFASAELIKAARNTNISDRTLRRMLKTEKKIQTQVQAGKTQRTAARAAAASSAAQSAANAQIEESKTQLSASQARTAQMQAYANLIDGGVNQEKNPVNENDNSSGRGSYATDWIS